MKRVHIVGTARSGTSLMLELLVNGFRVDGYAPKEQSVLTPPNPLPGGIYCSKEGRDTGMVRALLRCDPNLWIIFMLRDPRDVISSRHAKRPDLYWNNLRLWRLAQRAARRVADHPRFVTVRYENLVSRPDDAQEDLARRIPFLTIKAPFSRYHLTADVSEELVEAMHGVRPITAASVGAWRENKSRVVGQMNVHGSLVGELIALGYEPDDSWLESLEGIEADGRPGFQPDHPPRRRHRLRRWVETWALMPRYVIVRRLGSLRSRSF